MRYTRYAAAIALIPVLSAPLAAATKTERVERLFSVPAGTSLSVSNVNGPVVVSSWDRPQIRLIAEKRVRAGSEAAAAEGLEKLKIVIEHRDGALHIHTRHPRRDDGGILHWLAGNDVNASVSYELTVPRHLDIDLETVNGAVNVAGVNGHLRLETVNGRIQVNESAGGIEASTVNGSIEAELRQVSSREMSFGTVNGGVTIALPSSVRADLDVRTLNGSIESQLPVTTTASSRRHLRGQINGGGPSVEVRTTNGDVTIRRRN